jgi:hypothetical protein
MDSSKFINQEIQMLYLVNVDHNVTAAHLTRSDCEGSNVMNGTDEDMLWNDSEEVGNVRSECEADEDTECKDRESDTD